MSLAFCPDVAAAKRTVQRCGEPAASGTAMPIEPEGELPPADAGAVLHWYGKAGDPDGTDDVGWWHGRVLGGRTPLPTGRGEGLLTVVMEPTVGAEDEFNAWYDDEHLPRLSAVPGVLWAARFRASHSSPRYLAAYELSRPEVRHGSAWREAAAVTPWTSRVRTFTSGRRLQLWRIR